MLGLTVVSFAGHTEINDKVNFSANILMDSEVPNTHGAQAVEVTRPGYFPKHAFSQPLSATYTLELVAEAEYIDSWKDAQGWFDPANGEQYLVLQELNGADENQPLVEDQTKQRRLLCLPEKFAITGTNIARVSLKAAKGVWEGVTLLNDTESVTVSGTDWTVNNPGNTWAYPVFTLTPSAAMSAGSGPTDVRRVFVANRSTQPLTDFNGEKYPIDISEGAFSAPGDDVRVYLYGEEQPRWTDGDKLWVNLHMRPKKTATLESAIDGDDTELTVDNVEGFAGWPQEGWTFIDDEPVRYVLAGVYSMTLAYRPEGIGHSAGAELLWIEHVIDVVSGQSSPGTPPDWLDSKPRINLTDSDNTLHVWDGDEDFLPDHDRRSRSWRRVTEAEQSPNIRLYNDSGTMVAEELPPETGKPIGDTAEMRFPVPLIGPLEYDSNIGLTLHQLITAYDLGGFVSELVSELWSDGMQTDLEAELSNPATLLRIKARLAAILGEVNDDEGFLAMDLTSGSLGKRLPIDTNDPPTYSILFGLLHVSIHFVLEEDTEVNAIMVQFSDGADEVNGWFFKGGEKSLDIQLWGVTFPAGDGWRFVEVTAGGDTTRGRVLAAGEYWLSFEQGAGQLKGVARSKANIYGGQMIWPAELLTPNTPVPDGDRLYIGSDITVDDEVPDNLITSNMTPLFALLSKKQEPQADAPLQTGYTVVVDNISAPLDPDTAPKIYAAPEENLFFITGQLRNVSTGKYVDITFPCREDQGLEIDCEAGQATDLQTGEKVPWALSFSDLQRRIYLKTGDNLLDFTQVGLGTVAVLTEYRGAYL